MEQPTVDTVIARVRAWARLNKWTAGRYASETGLSESTLRYMFRDHWNPTVETLRALEAVIPETWRDGQPLPGDGGDDHGRTIAAA